MKKPDHLIINSPFEEPKKYWHYNRENREFSLLEGRRPAGYVVASEASKSFDDPGTFIAIPLVNKIRPLVKQWRDEGYSGVSAVTQRLLEYWNNAEEREDRRFFFCQLEAIETIIWLVEGQGRFEKSISLEGDGGEFKRICSKMATGTGKTVVMSMCIAWQILNKVIDSTNSLFSKNILIIAPNLTVKSRLQVLNPNHAENYYQNFSIVPSEYMDKLRQGRVLIHNWHSLQWDDAEKIFKRKSVDKRGAKSDEAYAREVLGELSSARDLVVINDEAHHAWRVPAESKIKGIKKEEIEEATKWVGGLDRINKARNILNCFDFSATPFAPSGKKTTEEALFPWIISDFGLNDAIESGLVKTPRVVVRDNSKRTEEYKSRLYHIYNDPEVKDDLSRAAEKTEKLPDLVINAYYLLGQDWEKTYDLWKEKNYQVPPVMITVANRTNTSSRIKYAFENEQIKIKPLCDIDKILQIDAAVLEMTEEESFQSAKTEIMEDVDTDKLSKKDQAILLRRKVDTIGQMGMPGEQIYNIISVGMLTEGWDAKTVTHIMGLRAFSSQLLCEQVVGRGLRRTSYEINPETNLFNPEYVNIFGVPFTFLPHEDSGEGPLPPPPPPRTRIEPDERKIEHEIRIPNVIRINRVLRNNLKFDLNSISTLEINANDTTLSAELAPIIDGKIDITKSTEIDLEEWGNRNRLQNIIFHLAKDMYVSLKENWQGNSDYLLAQIIQIVENFIKSDKIIIQPDTYNQNETKRKVLLALNMTKVFHHLVNFIQEGDNLEYLSPIFSDDKPLISTSSIEYWHTSKPCEYTKKSHINFTTYDSTWEASEAYELDHNSKVVSWVKNDHLGFCIYYSFKGIIRRYYPDFIIKLKNGIHLVLEVKGQEKEIDKVKRNALGDWVTAINQDGRFGKWKSAVSYSINDVLDIIEKS